MKKEDFSNIIKESALQKVIGFDEYQMLAMKTRLATATPLYCLLNLPAEVGEVCGKIAKAIRDGVSDQEAYRNDIRKELGDVLWHVAAVALDNGFTMQELATGNLEKLKDRQEKGTLSGSGDSR